MVGHTHVPGVFTDEPDFYPPSELGESGYKFRDGEKAVINVGSVGQPRDMDPRASYAIVHGAGESPGSDGQAAQPSVEFVRVPYNIDVTAKKIKSIAQLNDWLRYIIPNVKFPAARAA